ncbi:hypothetical protein B0J11DRAFT_446222 [Dendryphion nanum]|uniref:Uncharacterized protein n=1 Tax=Dendryphion nanum TaxID=256645 RepID=A0A9P9IAU2_9PLEO|nr:hypothetical protein B0J11DRAFT_446222 [Dendryphion nanum]
MSSADSAPSANSHSPPPAVLQPAPYPPPYSPPSPAQNPQRRRQTLVAEDRNNSNSNSNSTSTQASPRKAPLQRAPSQSSRTKTSRDRRSTTSAECTVPGCDKCPPPTRPRGRPERPKLDHSRDSAINLNYPPYDQVSQHSEPPPSSYSSPRSPTYRQPANYPDGSAVLQPAQSTRRRAPSNARARPVSYHGGDPGQSFYPNAMSAPYSSQPHEHHGPPPASSAHYAMQHVPPHQMSQYQSMYGATPPSSNGFYQPQPHPMQMSSSPYESHGSRPAMHSRTSSNNYHARGPMSSQYGQPLVTHAPALPSARFAPQPQPLPQPPQQLQLPAPRKEKYTDPESSEFASSGSEEEDEEEELVEERKPRVIMGPPKSKPAPQRRPSMSHRAKTTQVYQSDRHQPISQSMVLPERPRERESRSRTNNAAPSRAASTSRPPLVRQKAQSYSTPQAEVMVESSKSRRRQSQIYQPYQVQQPDYEVEERRRPKVYRQDPPAPNRRKSMVYEHEYEIYPDEVFQDDAIAPTRRRKTDADANARRRQSVVVDTLENLEDDIEAYQQRMRGSNNPLNDHIHRVAKRSSYIPSAPSHAASGSDKQTRISHLQFNGDMEGRTLQIHPAEDGMAELVIGNARETTYPSERGSTMGSNGGRKALPPAQARREAEEMSIRSNNTSRSRRDREKEIERSSTPARKVLQRRRGTMIDSEY